MRLVKDGERHSERNIASELTLLVDYGSTSRALGVSPSYEKSNSSIRELVSPLAYIVFFHVCYLL